jgi:4'-phosphopantetheinyl transferase
VTHALGPNDVHVWLFSTNVSAEEHREFGAILSGDERARANRLVFQADKVRFVATHALMRMKLGEYCDMRPEHLAFGTGDHGKPYLSEPDTPFQFNLSHSGSLATLAVTRSSPCGIDVEIMRTKIDDAAIAGRFFNDRENESLRSLPVAQRREGFFRRWAVKEAILKAAGKGLTQPLSSIDTTKIMDGASPQVSFADAHGQIRLFWAQELNVEAGYASALAIENAAQSSPHVQLFRW